MQLNRQFPSTFSRVVLLCSSICSHPDMKWLHLIPLMMGILKGSMNEIHSQSKRQINSLPLVFPYGAIYKLILGFALPIHNENRINMQFITNFQYQYMQFMNISELSQYYVIKDVSRDIRDGERIDERFVFYRSIADIMNLKGMNGYDCVRKAICETAQSPLDEEGFVGKIIHVLLTPDYGKTPFDDVSIDWTDEMSSYIDAAVVGRQMFSCGAIYTGCPEGEGIMEYISYLGDE